MTIKEDFYEIVNVQDDSIIQEAISDGIKTYLERLGFNTEAISFNINIEMYVDSDRIREYKEKSSEFLQSYCDLLEREVKSEEHDEELAYEYEGEWEALTEFLDEYD